MPLYLFHGEDSYSSHQKIRHWQQEFDKKYGNLNRESFEGATFTSSQFIGIVETVPFLSDKRLIIIHDFLVEGKSEEIKKTADLFERIPDHSIVVFIERKKADARTSFFKNISKIGQVTEFALLETPELIRWIQTQSQQHNLSLTPSQAKTLAESVGPDLWQLSQEIEKLSIYSQGKPLTDETLDTMVSSNITTSIFKLTDSLGLKQPQQALKILHQLLERGENLIQIIAMITRHFRILIQTQEGLNQKMSPTAIAKNIKQHPFVIQNSIRQVKNFSSTQLKELYKQLLDIDIHIKTGRIRITTEDISELQLAVERLIVGSIKTVYSV